MPQLACEQEPYLCIKMSKSVQGVCCALGCICTFLIYSKPVYKKTYTVMFALLIPLIAAGYYFWECKTQMMGQGQAQTHLLCTQLQTKLSEE